MYAIWNKKTGKYIVGTDFTRTVNSKYYYQKTSSSFMRTYDTAYFAQLDLLLSKCDPEEFEVVRVNFLKKPLYKSDLHQIELANEKANDMEG